jgi:hypothetical protein
MDLQANSITEDTTRVVVLEHSVKERWISAPPSIKQVGEHFIEPSSNDIALHEAADGM